MFNHKTIISVRRCLINVRCHGDLVAIDMYVAYILKNNISTDETHRLAVQQLSFYVFVISPLEQGFRVLDLCCGRGAAARNIAHHFPNSSVVGLDIIKDAIEFARDETKKTNLKNVEFVCGDATAMPAEWANTFDYVFTYDGVHDLARPDLQLKEIRRILKPSGFYSCFEPNLRSKLSDNIKIPHATMYYTASMFYCLPSSYHFPDSLGLGACWGTEAAVELLEKCGFTVQSVEKRVPDGDAADTLHYWCTVTK